MHRFFVSPNQINENTIIIKGDDVKHIGAVLRMKKSEKLIVCDGQNTDYDCIIKDITKKAVELEIAEKKRNTVEPTLKIRLYQSIPKIDKMDFIIQKCVELGVDEIMPIITDYTIIKVDNQKIDKKLERWNKISETAAKQCMRGKIPKVLNPINFSEAVEHSKSSDIALIPYEYEKLHSLKFFIKDFTGINISIFIGPEGGFSQNEIDLAKQNNIKPITLGNRILRTETAGLVTIANILYELGDG